MPFSKRIVNPSRIGRLSDAERKSVENAGEFLAVSHCAMVGLLQQLTSVTKHADGIFSDLCEECRLVLARTDAIRKRCDVISGVVEKFNHKTEKLPQGDLTRISRNPSHHYHHHIKLDKDLFTNQTRPECVQDQYDAAIIDRDEVRRVHEEYREKDGLIWEQEFQKGSASDLDEKIPNLDIETRKPAILGLLEREKHDKESPWLRPRSADMLCFMKENTNIDDLPLPTPEEALRRNAKSQPSVLIPVDITGTTFNRMCEFRRSLRGSMEYEQRKSRKRRRRTVSGIPGEVSRELDDMGFGLSADGPATIERSKTLDFESNTADSLLDFRISRGDLRYSRDEVFSDSPERDEVKRGPGDHAVHAPERHEKRSLRGSFRNLSCLGNRAEARSRQRSTIRERENRSRSLPPDRHKAESSAIMQKEPEAKKPLERTISQETLQSISNQQFNLVRCLSFHKLRRSRSMSGNKDKKEKKRQLSRAKSQDFDTLKSCEDKTNDKEPLPLSRAKSQDFDTIRTVKKVNNNKKSLFRAKSQDFDAINSCGYKSEEDLDHDEGIAVSQENIADSRDNVTARERLSPAERLLKKEKRKSLGKRLSQFWSNVQFRSHGNKKRPSKEDRQSSSGAWSASSESMRQSSGSAGSGPSPDRTSFKDSALELRVSVQPPLVVVDSDRASQKGSIHGSLMDVRRNFTAMDSDAWLKQTLEQRNKKNHTKEIFPIKDLTQANLEAHDLRTITDNGIVIDEEGLSEYSVDQEGFYTSMHTDSGLNKRHSMHSVLSGSVKDVSDPARYMFRSNMTLDSVIYKPKEENTIMSEGKSTDTLTAETPGYLSMNVVAKGPEMVPPTVPPHSKNSVNDTSSNKKNVPPPPKRISTLNRSMSSADDSFESIDGAIAMPPMDSFVTPMLMPRSLSENSSLNNSKVTLNSTESESDHQHIYARVKMKTAINTSMYPSMCSVTPMGSDDETISLRSESRSDSDFTVSSIATPSSVPSPWSNFKSPYSTIDKYKNLMKQSSIAESTPVTRGGYKSQTLPRKMSFKQFALKETEEEKRKRWSAENKSISSDDSGEHFNSNSWPRSPPFRQKKIGIPKIEGSITESKDEAPMIPPKPLIVKSGSSDSLKSNSSGGKGSGDLGSISGKAAMKPIPEIKTFSEYQELLKGVSPDQPDGVTAAESMLSLSSSSSQSTGISSMSSGSGSGSEGTVPSKYQHMITVRPKTGNPAQILSPTDRSRPNLMSSIDNRTSKVEYVKTREQIYANTPRNAEQRPLYANLNNRPNIYANSLAKTNIYANTNTPSNIYSNRPGYANTANLDAGPTSQVSQISPPRPELIYAITNVVKSEAAVPKSIDPQAPHYATSNLVKTPPKSTRDATDSTADTSSGYIQMSWPENKADTELKRVSSFMGSKDKSEAKQSDYSTLSSFAAKWDAEKKSFKMTEDADKCVISSQSEEAAPKTSGTMPKPFQPGNFAVVTIGPTSTQNKYATIGKGRKLSIDANIVAGGGKSGSGGPVMSTAALVELARRNSSPALTPQYSPPSRQVSVPDTILAEPSSHVEKTSLPIDTVPGPTTISDRPVVNRSESNNNSVSSSQNKNKGRMSLDSGLSKSRDSLSSTKSAKARISLDGVAKPAPLTELDYLKRMKSLSPGDEGEDLQKSRDSIDEIAVMDILDSIRSTINIINNDKHNEATTERTSPTTVVTKAPFYGTTV